MRPKFVTPTLFALISLYTLLSFQLPFFALPHVRGQTDLIVTGTGIHHITDSVEVVTGNVIVEQNGTLILQHGTLNETAPSGYNITIRDNGQLILEAGSSITSQNALTLFVRNNGTLTVKDNSIVSIKRIDVQTTQSILIRDSSIYTSNFTSSSQSFAMRNSTVNVSGLGLSTFSSTSTQALSVADSSIYVDAQSSSLALTGYTSWVNNSLFRTRSHAISSGYASTALYAASTLTVNNTVVSIHNSSLIPVALTLTVVAPKITMRDSHLDLPLTLTGTSTANLVNVTMPSIPKATGSSRITTYWWLTTTAVDNANLGFPGATVNAYFNYPNNQTLANLGVTNKLGQVKLQLLDTIYTPASTSILHNYKVNATFQSFSSGSATPLQQPMTTNQLSTVKLPLLSPSLIILQTPQSTIQYGSLITLKGSLRPAQTATISIGMRPQGTKTFAFQNVTSSNNGNFSLTLNATALGTFEAQAYWNGSFPGYHGNQSNLLIITVNKIASTLTATLSSNPVELIPFIGSVIIAGSIAPLRSNVNLTVQYSLDGVNWNLIGYTLTDSAGAYSIHWYALVAGRYMIRVLAPGSAYYLAALSTQTLVVNYVSLQNAIYILVSIIVLAAIVSYMRRGRRTPKFRPHSRKIPPKHP